MKPEITIRNVKGKSIQHNFAITANYPQLEGSFIVGHGLTMEEAIADLIEGFQYSPDFVDRINKIESPEEEIDSFL